MEAQSSLAQLIKKSENLTALNSLLRDVVMLENQIPLFVMQMLLMKFQYPSKKMADQELLDMLIEIGQDLSPFLMQRSKKMKVDNCEHLLDFLYKFIVPTEEKPCYGIYDFIDEENSDEQKELDCNDDQDNNKDSFSNPKNAWHVFRTLWKFISPVSKKLVSSKPFRLVSQLQPVMKMAKGPVVNILSTLGKTNKEKKEDEESPKSDDHMHPTLKLEEIAIPSVSELVAVGVKFKPINDGITSIKFDVKTQVFQIPVIDLDANTEVVLRNLVAYEAGGIPGPLVLARYIELMNGIIDTDVDAKLLCREGIINNHLKTVKEVADLWNGMSKSIRLTKVESLDKLIEEVNNFYKSRWKVKFEKFLKEYVFGSWRFLTFLATLALLLLMTLQAFCQVYSCGRLLPIQGLEPLTED